MNFLICLTLLNGANAFLPVTTMMGRPSLQFVVELAASKVHHQQHGSSDQQEWLQDGIVSEFQHQWVEEEAHLQAYEDAVMNDPDLDNVVDHIGAPNKEYMDREAHKHDSLLSEIEHSIDTDPYLAGITDDTDHNFGSATFNSGHMEREEHKHDSLWNEIEHSISTDPDLL